MKKENMWGPFGVKKLLLLQYDTSEKGDRPKNVDERRGGCGGWVLAYACLPCIPVGRAVQGVQEKGIEGKVSQP